MKARITTDAMRALVKRADKFVSALGDRQQPHDSIILLEAVGNSLVAHCEVASGWMILTTTDCEVTTPGTAWVALDPLVKAIAALDGPYELIAGKVLAVSGHDGHAALPLAMEVERGELDGDVWGEAAIMVDGTWLAEIAAATAACLRSSVPHTPQGCVQVEVRDGRLAVWTADTLAPVCYAAHGRDLEPLERVALPPAALRLLPDCPGLSLESSGGRLWAVGTVDGIDVEMLVCGIAGEIEDVPSRTARTFGGLGQALNVDCAQLLGALRRATPLSEQVSRDTRIATLRSEPDGLYLDSGPLTLELEPCEAPRLDPWEGDVAFNALKLIPALEFAGPDASLAIHDMPPGHALDAVADDRRVLLASMRM